MTAPPKVPDDFRRRVLLSRLGVGHFAAALVAALALAASITGLPVEVYGDDADELRRFRTIGFVCYGLGVVYLTLACAANWQWGRVLWRTTSVQRSSQWLAHLLVLIAAVVALSKGLDSRSMLAGLDRLLPGLIVVSTLSSVLLLIGRWAGRATLQVEAARADAPSVQRISVVLTVVCLGLFLGLLFFERLPLPNTAQEKLGAESPT